MSENNQNMPSEQPASKNDIDLRELFRMIGNAFSRLFSFIGKILLFIFDLIIRALIIIRVHIVKFVIVGFLSIVIGWFLDSRQESVYGSSMYVQANYGSTRQLYSNIKYYQGLIDEGDSTALANIFEISETEALKLRAFYIEPDVTENGILKAYNEFMKQSDSLYVYNEINYAKFKENISPLDYGIHQISVFSADKGVIPKLQNPLVNKNIENNYIKRQKEANIRNLERTEEALRKQLVQIDTLSEVYKELLLKEPKETTSKASNTYIQLAPNSDKKTKEIELLTLNETISQKIVEINKKKELENQTINVLNDFSPGAKVRSFYDRNLLRIPMITLSLLLLFILLRELNSYLNRYTENKRLNA